MCWHIRGVSPAGAPFERTDAMQTYRVFDCSHATAQPSDILVFGPRWLARLIVAFKGGSWDYQSERLYQRHYERAASR